MHSKHMSIVVDIRQSSARALERLAERAEALDRGSKSVARRLSGLGRELHGKDGGLERAMGTMERLHRAFADLGNSGAPAGAGLERMRSLFSSIGSVEGASGLPVQAFAMGGGVLFPRLTAPYIHTGSGTRDDVPALLMRGEYVLRRSAVQRYGIRLLEALNQERLPLELIPAFRDGGPVLPPQFVDIVPRFSDGGTVGYLRGATQGGGGTYSQDQFLGYFSALANQDPEALVAKYGGLGKSEIVSDIEQRVADLAARVKFSQLQNSPEKYLSAAIGTVTGTLEVFQSMKLTDPESLGGILNGATADLASQAAALNREYKARIALAKSEGDEQLAMLLELERLELEAVVEELRAALEDLLQNYMVTVESLAEKTVAEAESMGEDYAGQAEGISEKLAALGSLGSVTGNRILNNTRTRLQRQLSRLETRAMLEARRLERNFERSMNKEKRSYARLADSAEREHTLEGVNAETTARLDIRKTFNDYKRSIQDLEIEWKRGLQELMTSMSGLNVSGFSHWLSQGGVVGAPLAFAKGGVVPDIANAPSSSDTVPAMLTPGEFVLRRDAVRAIGLAELTRLNSLDASIIGSLRQVLAFADGGLVPGATTRSQELPNLGAITLDIGGRSFEARMTQGVARSLRRELSRRQKARVG